MLPAAGDQPAILGLTLDFHSLTIALEAARQLGLVTTAQALASGLSRSTLWRNQKAGVLVQMRPGVYRMNGSPVTSPQYVLAACLQLGPSAVASHLTAAWLWGLDRLSKIPTIHEVSTSLELAEFLGQMKGDGHQGISRLAALLRINEGRPATGSDFETDVLQLIRSAGIHEPDRQHPVFETDDHPFAFLDFAWPWKKLALYADGGSYHLAPEQARKDAWQRMKLAKLGWTSIVVMPKMIEDANWVSSFAELFHPKLG